MGETLMQRRRVWEDGPLDCKPLSPGTKMTVPGEEAPANYVPAAAVIRRERALSGITGCKGSGGGDASWVAKLPAQLVVALKTAALV